jgi:hypothetical protein
MRKKSPDFPLCLTNESQNQFSINRKWKNTGDINEKNMVDSFSNADHCKLMRSDR